MSCDMMTFNCITAVFLGLGVQLIVHCCSSNLMIVSVTPRSLDSMNISTVTLRRSSLLILQPAVEQLLLTAQLGCPLKWVRQEMNLLILVSWRLLALYWNRKCPERVTPRDDGHFVNRTKTPSAGCVQTIDEKCDFHFLSFLVLLFAEPSRRKLSPWTLRSTVAWAAVRICPRSAPPSTPSDLFDPSSFRPSSPPHLPSMPIRHLQVRNAFLKTAPALNYFPAILLQRVTTRRNRNNMCSKWVFLPR